MQDHTREIEAGKSVQIEARGDFVYCKSASREWRLLVNGAPTLMQKGDWRRETTTFDAIELHNPGTDKITVTVVIGHGEYDRKIVSGEITVKPGITTASGEFVADTRTAQQWRFAIAGGEETHTAGEAVKLGEDSPNSLQYVFERDGLIFGISTYYSTGSSKHVDAPLIYDLRTGERLGELKSSGVVVTSTMGSRGWAYDRARDRLYAAENTNDNEVMEFYVSRADTWPMVNLGGVALPYITAPRATLVGAHDGTLIFHDEDKAFVIYNVDTQEGYRVVIDGVENQSYQSSSITYKVFMWDELSGKWLVARNSHAALFEVDADFKNATFLRNDAFFDEGSPMGGGFVVSTPYDTSNDYYVTYMRDQTYGGKVVIAGTGGVNKAETVVTEADVVTLREDSGRWIMRGEVLKAVLRAKLGDRGVIPPNYMDYIYRFEYTDAAGQSQIVDTGASSFAEVGIPDQFSALTPTPVAVTARRGLIS